MKAKACLLFTLLVLLTCLHGVMAQGLNAGMQFFRVSGPGATSIMALGSDGTLVWSNVQPGGTFTIQSANCIAEGSHWINYLQVPNANSFNTNFIPSLNPTAGMVAIPAGSFTMGDPLDGETDAIPTSVAVSGFYLDTNLVSFSQWQAVYFYANNNGYSFTNAGAGKAGNQPVQTVDWYDSVKWCNARSQQAGLVPVYYTDSEFTQVYTNGETDQVYPNWAANGYRLPTEAEWEKAARGGLSGLRFPWGDTISESQANYYGFPLLFPSYDLGPQGYNPTYNNSVIPYTSPVGSFAPNGYGLCDMAGNVQEWCWDWYGTPYAGSSNPTGPATGTTRVFRGGVWFSFASLCNCASRGNVIPSNADYGTGFRCAKGF